MTSTGAARGGLLLNCNGHSQELFAQHYPNIALVDRTIVHGFTSSLTLIQENTS